MDAPRPVGGDPFYYHHAANLFADGRGWPDPYDLLLKGTYVHDAQHPPLTSMLLAIPSLFGFTGFLAHQVFTCLLGTAAVVVTGLVGRTAAGGATGLVAAGIAAVYPGMWLNDALVMSETTGILACCLLLLAAYRFWETRRAREAAWLGAALAAATLARAELGLLAFTCVVPLVLGMRGTGWRRRVGLAAVAGAASLALVAPWAAYNLARFSEPEFISTGLGSTLAVTHCPATYSGQFTGWWSYDCIQRLERTGSVPEERSERDAFFRREAYTFVGDHAGDIPRVGLARFGRTWGLYRPWQQVQLDTIELRPRSLSRAGTVSLWVLEAAAVAGVVLLRRRRVTVIPLLSTPVALSAATVMVYGTTRFRAAAEPSLVLLASVALAAAGAVAYRRLRRGTAPAAFASNEPGIRRRRRCLHLRRRPCRRRPCRRRPPAAGARERRRYRRCGRVRRLRYTRCTMINGGAWRAPGVGGGTIIGGPMDRAAISRARLRAAGGRCPELRGWAVSTSSAERRLVPDTRLAPDTLPSVRCVAVAGCGNRGRPSRRAVGVDRGCGGHAVGARHVPLFRRVARDRRIIGDHRPWRVLRGNHPRTSLGPYTARGEIGVAVFFLISGFLLYRPFVAAHFAGTGAPDTAGFFIRRFLRIIPLFWVALGVTLLVVSDEVLAVHGFAGLLQCLFFVQGYREAWAFQGLTQAWTLDVEVAFYLSLPVYAWLLSRRREPARRRLSCGRSWWASRRCSPWARWYTVS
jgi:hypothetical protein